MPDKDGKIGIRNLDPLLYQNARVAALKRKQNIGGWINAAIVAKLKHDKKGEVN